MLNTYLKTAWRSLLKNKIFSVINILGLSLGISAALVIYLMVAFDLGFDRFEKDKTQIYRVVTTIAFTGEPAHTSGVCYPLASALQREATGIDMVVPVNLWDENTRITVPGTASTQPVTYKKQSHIVFADGNYFKLLGYKWLAGSARSSLQQPGQVVLTASQAQQLFPAQNITALIGKNIIFNDTVHTTITGIVADLDNKTDFNFNTFVSGATLAYTSLRPAWWTQWTNLDLSSQLFVKLSAGTSVAHIEKQANDLLKKYTSNDPNNKIKISYSLQPLSDLHFNATYKAFNNRVAHKPTLYGLLAVAAFLLLLGCINFINLTTARAGDHAKETGIRKTMGSLRSQLIYRFLTETFLLTLIACALSLLLSPVLLKIFEPFVPEGLRFQLNGQVILFLLALLVTVSLLSGLYPAIVLSSFNSVQVLKNQAFSSTSKTRTAWLRKSLTITQFVIAQVFIIATLLVSKQIRYSLNKDLGFKKEAILYFKADHNTTDPSYRQVLIEKLRAIPEIATVSLSSDPPIFNRAMSSNSQYLDGKKELELRTQIKLCDTSYIQLYHLNLLAGTNLPQSDTPQTVLVNESYAHAIGFMQPEQLIGKKIKWNDIYYPVTGVVADFHEKSLHEPIRPLIITTQTEYEYMFNVALLLQNAAGTNWQTAIQKMEKAWKEVYPEEDFDYHFLEDAIAQYYQAEQNISHLLAWSTGFTIVISCLGLLGLVTYITQTRTKEIGIRKVVGASVAQLVVLLSKDFIKLVLIAFVIAVPIAWWGAHEWLQNFAYKTTLSIWLFLAGGLILLLMALMVLGLKTYRAATANPVNSLKSE